MPMEIWERTSQQLTCKLNFLQAEFRKFLFGYLEVVLSIVNLAAPWSVPTQQTVYVVAPTLQLLMISLAKLFFQTPLDRRGMASFQSKYTFSFKHHLTGEAWPSCRAILSFHSNTLTDEAWPGCRAIQPFHSNTT